MLMASATDYAIRLAVKNGTLRIVERVGRFGLYWAIEDDKGTIEVHDSKQAAEARVHA